ncbi:MAG: Tim44/TimA family putative adaptor protein [Alphaproteobacteria bacterium]|jgi:predicted lipid-binding transport protein (Tim44 family)
MNNYSDIVLFALIALALVFKLVSILGQKDQNRSYTKFTDDNQNHSATVVIDKTLTPKDQLKLIDPSYDEEAFLENAKSAFKIILEAYAQGSTRVLSDLLDIEMMKKFVNQVVSRENLKQQAEINVLKINSATIEDIKIINNDAKIKVNFIAETILNIMDQKQKIIFGHQNKIENLKTQWVFKKNLKASDPTWKLVDVDNIPFTEI